MLHIFSYKSSTIYYASARYRTKLIEKWYFVTYELTNVLKLELVYIST